MPSLKYKLILTIAIITIIIFVSMPAMGGKKKKPKPSSSPTLLVETVKLTVKSNPSGATVVLDRVIRGVTPITLSVEKGKHLLRVSIDENWVPHIEEKDFEEDEVLEISLTPRNEYSYSRGKEAFDKGDYADARTFFREAVSPGGKIVPAAFFYMAIMDHTKQDYAKMEENIKKYIQLNPPKDDFVDLFTEIHTKSQNYGVKVSHFLLGEYYRKDFKWSEAATSFKLSIPEWERFINPDIKATYENIKNLREITGKDMNDYKSLIQLAYLYEIKGMLFQSMMAYREAAKGLFCQSPAFMTKYGKYIEGND